jgi:hypothetical protein
MVSFSLSEKLEREATPQAKASALASDTRNDVHPARRKTEVTDPHVDASTLRLVQAICRLLGLHSCSKPPIKTRYSSKTGCRGREDGLMGGRRNASSAASRTETGLFSASLKCLQALSSLILTEIDSLESVLTLLSSNRKRAFQIWCNAILFHTTRLRSWIHSTLVLLLLLPAAC